MADRKTKSLVIITPFSFYCETLPSNVSIVSFWYCPMEKASLLNLSALCLVKRESGGELHDNYYMQWRRPTVQTCLLWIVTPWSSTPAGRLLHSAVVRILIIKIVTHLIVLRLHLFTAFRKVKRWFLQCIVIFRNLQKHFLQLRWQLIYIFCNKYNPTHF